MPVKPFAPAHVRFRILERENDLMPAIGGDKDGPGFAGLFTEETGHAILLVGDVGHIPEGTDDVHGANLRTLPAACAFLSVDRLNHLDNLQN